MNPLPCLHLGSRAAVRHRLPPRLRRAPRPPGGGARVGPPRAARAWIAAAALAALLAAPGRLPAQDAVQRVVVDLRSGSIRGQLPFDERFFIVGKTTPGLTRVGARYRPSPAGMHGCGAADTWTDSLAHWANAPADSFYLSVGDSSRALLRPDRYYLFCIRTLSRLVGDDSVAFEARVQRGLDVSLRAWSRANDLTPAQVGALQRALVRSLPAPAPGGRILIAENSLFDTIHPPADTKAQLQVAGLLDAQTRRTTAIANVGLGSGRAQAELAQLQRGFGAELRAIAGARARPQDAPARFALAAEAARLIGDPEPPDFFTRVASGEVALSDTGTAPPLAPLALDEVWEPREVEGALRALSATQERLTALRAVASSLAADRRALEKLGVRRERMVLLTAALDALRGQVADVQLNYTDLQDHLSARRDAIASVARYVSRTQQADAPLLGSSIETALDTRTRRYVSADIGVLYAFGVDQAAPYAGVNFYPTGVNRRVPQSVVNSWNRSLAVMVGLTLQSLAKDGERKDFFGSTSAVVGAGWRFLDVLRASAGAVVVRDLDDSEPEPHSRLALAPFLSLSFDWDARSAFGKVGDLLGQ